MYIEKDFYAGMALLTATITDPKEQAELMSKAFAGFGVGEAGNN